MACDRFVPVVADVGEVFAESCVKSAASFPHILHRAFCTEQDIHKIRSLAVEMFCNMHVSLRAQNVGDM